jgi:glycosyltransferase involved in cell wall biosynthesis
MPQPMLSVVILTLNEEANLPVALASLRGLDAEIFLVDSGSTDRTLEIARAAGCRVVEHPFENYAVQRNWAFDHLPIGTPWTLCLDADERLTPELVDEIKAMLSQPDNPYDGYMLRKRTIFMGRWLRHGGQYPAYHLRLFRSGRGRCEARLYDQHFVVDGQVGKLRNDYVDVITSDLGTFVARHNRWAELEAAEILARSSGAARQGPTVAPVLTGTAIERRRFLRTRVYHRFPLFVRPFLFWFYGYVLRAGFLDGIEGLVFHTLQRFWFRFLVDARIWERQRARSHTLEKRPPQGRRWGVSSAPLQSLTSQGLESDPPAGNVPLRVPARQAWRWEPYKNDHSINRRRGGLLGCWSFGGIWRAREDSNP